MVALLSVIIGIVFVLLLFSLLTTTVMEMIAGFFSLRGKHLVLAVQNMLGSKTRDFMQHPYFRQLTMNANTRGGKRVADKSFPSYIGAGTFSAILEDVLEGNPEERISTRVEALPDGDLKKVLSFLWRQAGDDAAAFRQKTDEWYDEVMDRASGWYKRKTRTWLLLVGGVITVLFNVDTIQIYNNLTVNATLRDFVAESATTFVNTQPQPDLPTVAANPDFFAAQQKIAELVNNNISAVASPLGLGWDGVDWSKSDRHWWLYKIIGWLTTTIALSLGATFWFGILKQLIGLRSSGPVPPAGSGLSATAAAGTAPAGSFLTRPGTDSPFESVSRTARKPAPEPDPEADPPEKKEMPDG